MNHGSVTPGDHYTSIHEGLVWSVPLHFNIAQACCSRWAMQTPHAIAISYENELGELSRFSFAQLQDQANRLSKVLRQLGVQRGDRVAIVLAQRFEAAVAHMAVYQLAAIAMPLSQLFGPEALEFRLNDSGAKVAIVDENSATSVRQVRARCQALSAVLALGKAEGQGDVDWSRALSAQGIRFTPEITRADAPALLIYTSGTTGSPKGALIAHRGLIGNLSGFVCSQNWFPQPGDVFWSPADWAWTGGLLDAFLPTLYFGKTIVACQGRFSADRAFDLLQRHEVTNTFLFPTALKAMMKTVPHPRSQYALKLRAIMSAGESVGDAVFAWCRDELRVPVNEMFGQTEVNYVVGNCAQARDADGRPMTGWPAKPGSMGRPYPGHRVAVIDEEGRECPRGTPGEVATHALDAHGQADPVFFLGYWNNLAATVAKFTGEPFASWWRTGDMATMDADGYLWYQGRADDVFKAAGYRIGPGEIENCLLKHAAVANAAVVPKPDAQRGAVVKAYVVLAAGHQASVALVEALQAHVRDRLAPYEYPKEIEFIDSLPMTTTGKVQRAVLRMQEEQRAVPGKSV